MAIERFVEDAEDYLLAVSRLEKNKDKPNISWEEAKKRLGLLDENLAD